MGSGHVVEVSDTDCEAEGCSNVTRLMPAFTHYDGSVRDESEVTEHIAGPHCAAIQGYSGHRKSPKPLRLEHLYEV